MQLEELLNYQDIVIQCHDNPDADALASGFGVYTYLTEHDIKPRFIYGGKFPLQKSNLLLMKEMLGIPIEYVKELEPPQLLITVDCQYKGGNVTPFEADTVATIDHHQITGKLPEMNLVRSNLGSCSTIVWDMLLRAGMDMHQNRKLSTALYYGLMTDTNNFAELWHPLDKDMRDSIPYTRSDITCFRNSNLSLDELHIAGDALRNVHYIDSHRCGYVESKPCDPNILGVISDMLLEVDGVDTCLVYSILPFGVKISVRSCTINVKASEFAEYIAEGTGNGGGHLEKAGGFLEKNLLENAGVIYNPESVEQYMRGRLVSYFDTSEIIHAGSYEGDLSQCDMYVKKPVVVGYVESSLLGMDGQTAFLRTLEGDVDVKLSEDVYIMIGVEGEIYPAKREKFERIYEKLDQPYVYPGEYAPMVKNTKEGTSVEILPFAKAAVSKDTSTIVGKQLDHRVKVFTSWDEEKYYLGKPGDYLVARADDPQDVYIIAGRIMDLTYDKVDRKA